MNTNDNELKTALTRVQNELEERNQELHDCKRQLQSAKALEREYQQEIEALQKPTLAETEKFKLIIKRLENDLQEVKEIAAKQIQDLETEIASQKDIVQKLEGDLKTVTSVTLTDSDHISKLNQEIANLKTENENYKSANEEAKETNKELKSQKGFLESELEVLTTENNDLNENIACKKNELTEAKDLISTLQDDLIVMKTELDALKSKPLDEKCKGNSLFAEVDDRRLELQRNYQSMKDKYGAARKEHNALLQKISELRSENAKLCQMLESQKIDVIEDYELMIDTYMARVDALEVLLKQEKEELQEWKKVNLGANCPDYNFFQRMIDRKKSEKKKVEEYLHTEGVNRTLLSHQLKEAHAEIRNLKVKLIQLQCQESKVKVETNSPVEDHVPSSVNGKETDYIDYSRLLSKTHCNTAVYKLFSDCSLEETALVEDKIEIKENVNPNVAKKDPEEGKSVKFSADTADNVTTRLKPKGARFIPPQPQGIAKKTK